MQQENDCQENVWQWMMLAEKTPRKTDECSLVRRYIFFIDEPKTTYNYFFWVVLLLVIKPQHHTNTPGIITTWAVLDNLGAALLKPY
jgi:hypothetical protein